MRVSVRAPGRVNLIGEHTDYTGGLVLPVAIQLGTRVAWTPRHDSILTIRSESFVDPVVIDLRAPLVPRRHWSDYVVGVVSVLRDQGVDLTGGNLLIQSDVPRGAGLSSSAALEVATGHALLRSVGAAVDPLALAQCCQRAENEFVGARCGIMDQYVACFGRAGHAIRLDCRALESQALPIPDDVAIVVINTMVKHSVAGAEYNQRRAECEAATALIAGQVPGVTSLRDVAPGDLETLGRRLPAVLEKRARHVVSENGRVTAASDALRAGQVEAVGRLMHQSHRSLRDDFEVSCRELDLLVDLALSEPDAIGTRMTGGGFGGCTVSLVHRGAAERFVDSMQQRYAAATGTRPDAWICVASDGVREVTA